MSNDSNVFKQAFSDVVNIDAWHSETSILNPTADLHADVVFGEARVGGEKESKVRFRLSMKKAEIVLVVSETEPVQIDPSHVARHDEITNIKRTKTTESSKTGKVKGSASASVSPESLNAGISANIEGERSFSDCEKLEFTDTLKLMIVVQSRTHDGYYRWSVKPTDNGRLEGRPWNANESPRVKITDTRKEGTRSLPPVVKFEVRCRREDLIITDIELKEDNIIGKYVINNISNNKILAAEAYIRNKLCEEGLFVEEISDKFAKIVLCSVVATSSKV